MDINEGPLSHARKNIEKAGLSDCIDCRLSDGMQALNQGEVDTVLTVSYTHLDVYKRQAYCNIQISLLSNIGIDFFAQMGKAVL